MPFVWEEEYRSSHHRISLRQRNSSRVYDVKFVGVGVVGLGDYGIHRVEGDGDELLKEWVLVLRFPREPFRVESVKEESAVRRRRRSASPRSFMQMQGSRGRGRGWVELLPCPSFFLDPRLWMT